MTGKAEEGVRSVSVGLFSRQPGLTLVDDARDPPSELERRNKNGFLNPQVDKASLTLPLTRTAIIKKCQATFTFR